MPRPFCILLRRMSFRMSSCCSLNSIDAFERSVFSRRSIAWSGLALDFVIGLGFGSQARSIAWLR